MVFIGIVTDSKSQSMRLPRSVSFTMVISMGSLVITHTADTLISSAVMSTATPLPRVT
jgi:hypothetical protein